MYEIRREPGGITDRDPPEIRFGPDRFDRSRSIDMAKHHVAAESAIRRHRPFEIHERSRCKTAETRHRCGLRTDLRRKGSRNRFRVDDGQAYAVYRNALAGTQFRRDAAHDA